jgi:class 3 adenylate cyclase
MLITFDGPAQALRCAAQISAAAHQDELRIRAAVNIGEVEILEGDVRGIAVHEAARIMNVAGADEILVTEATQMLALAAGLAFDDRGVHELRGIGPTHLFAFVAPA